MQRRLPNLGAIIVAGLGAAGCQTHRWRPPLDDVRPAQSTEVDLASYFPSTDTFAQTFLIGRRGGPVDADERMTRQVNAEGYRQGLLVPLDTTALSRFLASEGEEEPPEYLRWPGEPDGNNAGFFLEFDPPLPYLPLELRPDQPVVHQGKVRAFNRWGHPARSGTVKRRIWLEGREDVTAAGDEYRDCVRVLAETRIRLRWGPHVDVTEYIWLAPRVGEIRRIERISGLALPFIFEDASTYELAPDRAERPVLVSYRPPPTRAWRRVAVYLDPLLPKPSVAGVIVEYAEEAPADSHQPATSQPD